MEPLIAVLILIGVLIVGGNAPDKGDTRSSKDSVAMAVCTDDSVKNCWACDHLSPRQRDLTVPYTRRMAPASVDAETRDE